VVAVGAQAGDEGDEVMKDIKIDKDGCSKCFGCGKIANDDDQSPWVLWEALEWPENIAVVSGLVHAIPCPKCGGTGKPKAEKTREEISQHDLTLGAIRVACRAAINIPLENVKSLLDDMRDQDTVMPIIDPTKYRANAENLHDNQALARAFNKFRKDLEEIREAVMAREGV
jgi:hypothetical protein